MSNTNEPSLNQGGKINQIIINNGGGPIEANAPFFVKSVNVYHWSDNPGIRIKISKNKILIIKQL